MDIISKKYWYFLFSAIIIIPGIMSLFAFGLNLGIDFTGGSKMEYKISNLRSQISNEEIKKTISEQGIEINSIQELGENTFILKTKPIDQEKNKTIQESLKKKFGDVEEVSFETVGATVSRETLVNAIKALILASILIVVYIAWSFRKVPRPASSWRFGICAIIALIHDALVVVGIFSLLGHFKGVEIDSLFVTALLTIIGFSVHDTIVVFDRIRENLKKMIGTPFEKIVNESIKQTLVRSINTSLTVVLALLAVLFFGGETVRWFVVALLVGIISGTYSSIFNASPLLVVWQELREKRTKKF